MRQIDEWLDVTPNEFESSILPSARPAVLRGVARDWPLVVAAKESADRWLGLPMRHATESPVDVIRAEPSEEGRFHYRPDGQSLNFARGQANLPLFFRGTS